MQVSGGFVTGVSFGGPGLTLQEATARWQAAVVVGDGTPVDYTIGAAGSCAPDASTTGAYGNQRYYSCTAPGIPNFVTIYWQYPVIAPAGPAKPGATVSDFSIGSPAAAGGPVLTGTIANPS